MLHEEEGSRIPLQQTGGKKTQVQFTLNKKVESF